MSFGNRIDMADNKNYDIILFDLDGTLTDPMLGITRSVQYSLDSFGIHEPCLENLCKFIGPPLKDSFMEFYDFEEGKAVKAVEKYREYFAQKGIFENVVYPGIPELLQKLHNSGKVLALATSKPTVFAERILEHFNILGYFRFIAGSNLDGSRVHKDEVIEYALTEMGLCASRKAVMTGDRKFDIIGAKKAGIDSIGVLYGYGTIEELRGEEPNFLAASVEELGGIIMSHSGR